MLHSYFNPRSRVGNDYFLEQFRLCIVYFNPRSRVGNDSRDRIVYLANLYFNPRSRVGNDVLQYHSKED